MCNLCCRDCHMLNSQALETSNYVTEKEKLQTKTHHEAIKLDPALSLTPNLTLISLS